MAAADDARFMREAIAMAQAGVRDGQSPFGAAVVRDGRLLGREHNAVLRTLDVSAHAEIHAVRTAAAPLGSLDLAGCVVYATGEPCAMCFGACYWAHVTRIVFGACSPIPRARLRRVADQQRDQPPLGRRRIHLVGGILRDECLAIFRTWRPAGGTKRY